MLSLPPPSCCSSSSSSPPFLPPPPPPPPAAAAAGVSWSLTSRPSSARLRDLPVRLRVAGSRLASHFAEISSTSAENLRNTLPRFIEPVNFARAFVIDEERLLDRQGLRFAGGTRLPVPRPPATGRTPVDSSNELLSKPTLITRYDLAEFMEAEKCT